MKKILFISLVGLASFLSRSVLALDWTVDPANPAGCSVADPTCTTLQAAVTAASSGDVINVVAGTYFESIFISKSLTLNGANAGTAGFEARVTESVVDCGLSTCFQPVSGVVIDGFLVRNGDGQGVLISSGTNGVTIQNNIIEHNVIGINVNGADHIIRRNFIHQNDLPGAAGRTGIYSDTSSNLLIEDNLFQENLNSALIFGATSEGLHQDPVIADNKFEDVNMAILEGVEGGEISGNTYVSSPMLLSNGTLRVGNGVTLLGGVHDLTIEDNSIEGGLTGIRVVHINALSESSDLTVASNQIFGQTLFAINANAGSLSSPVLSQNSWWGCNEGPGQPGCVGLSGDIIFDPWLVMGISADAATVVTGDSSVVTVDLTHDKDGVLVSTLGNLPDGIEVQFSADVGTFSDIQLLQSGQATALWTAGTETGTATITATLDNQVVQTTIAIQEAPVTPSDPTGSDNPTDETPDDNSGNPQNNPIPGLGSGGGCSLVR